MQKMRGVWCAFTGVGLTLVLCTGGCQSARSAAAPAALSHEEVQPGFVMPNLVLVELEQRDPVILAHWEAGRNNPPLLPAVAETPDHGGFKLIELRYRENLRTINGRPREHTSTRTRLWQRQGVYPRVYPRR